jgi:hypothetical protein
VQKNERQLIDDLFARLRSAEGQSRDPEIERLIAAELRRAPNAPYAMAQTIIAQNQALEAAAARIEELENGESYEDEEEDDEPVRGGPVRGAMGAPDIGRRGSVPGFGRDAAARNADPGAAQGGGGGFLANAGQVALGVAGGMLLGEAAKSLLGSGSEAQAATGAAGTASTANPLSQDAGAGDVGSGADDNSGGGGLFGWLFGDDASKDGDADDNDADDNDADGGDWDDGDGDSGGD